MNPMAGVALISPCQPKGGNVKIIRVDECIDGDDIVPVCPYCVEIYHPDGNQYECEHCDYHGDPVVGDVPLDCPLDEADHEG